VECKFCNYNVSENQQANYLNCPRCGIVNLSEEAYEDFDGENLSPSDKGTIYDT